MCERAVIIAIVVASEAWFSTGSNEIQAATTLAVGETILGQKTPAAEKQLAVDIIGVTTKIEAEVTTGVTVALLVAAAQAEVVKVGNPQEVLAGTTLLTTLQPIVTQYVGSGLLDAAAVVDLKAFCAWVIAAAKPYAGT